MSLRARLLLVAIAGIVPVAIAAGVALWASVSQASRSTETKTLELTRIAATAIGVELTQSQSVLRTLALSPLLDKPSLGDYRVLLDRFVAHNPGWSMLSLATPAGEILTSSAEDASFPPIYDQESFNRVLREKKPVIGRLLDRERGGWSIAIRVPVIRKGELRYVLSGLQTPDAILRVVERQAMPEAWVMSVFDAAGSRVARTREHARHLGGQGAPSLVQLMSSDAPSGTGITHTLEGTRGFTAYVRLPEFGWSVALSIPAASVIVDALKPALFHAFGILVAIGVALLVARAAAQGITEPMQALAAAASRVEADAVATVPPTRIAEIAALRHSLANAAEARQRVEQERVAAARERSALLESERAARAEAVRSGQLKDQFLAALSHELRTPLNSILGWSQILRHANASPADRDRGIDIIERNARAQAKLIEDLLDVSRITSGKMHLDLQIVEPTVAIRTAIEVARPAADAKGVRLVEDMETSAGPVNADPARLQQIIGNLLSNAVKFTPEGGRVLVKLRRSADQIEIVVSDNGQGIEPEFLPFLFDRFRQADASTTRMYGGLGLGLSIVKELATMHGGTVSARSGGTDQGAEFTVTLPIASRTEAMPAVPLVFSRDQLAGIRVLAVDDEPDARDLMTRLLEECGAAVTAVDSAEAALKALEGEVPGVLLSDVSMPQMDGYELIRRVRASPVAEVRSLPAIAVTAFARPEDCAQALAAGFSMHITKPIEPAALIAAVARRAQLRRDQS